MTKPLRHALPLLLAFTAAPLLAQQPAAPPTGNWEQLPNAERELLLQPLRERWNNADPAQRQRMLEHARRWRDMPADARARAHVGMRRFHTLTPEQQAQMRVLFESTRDMNPQTRREAFALFHAMRRMTPEQRQALRARWSKMTPEQREAWMRENAPKRGGGRAHHGD